MPLSQARMAPMPFSPMAYKSRLRVFVDVTMGATIQSIVATRFERALSQSAKTAGNASGDTLDFSAGGKWTVAISRNLQDIGTDRTYISKYNFGGTGRQWSISSGGSGGQEHDLRIFIFDGSSDVAGLIALSNKNWSRAVIAFDLSQGTAANRVRVYLDGSTSPVTAAVAWPSSMAGGATNGATKVVLGTFGESGSATGFYYNGTLRNVRLWGRALSAADAGTESGSAAVNYAAMSASLQSGCVAAWDLNADLTDASGNGWTLTAVNGPLALQGLCNQLTERRSGVQFAAPRYFYAPWYVPSSPLNGRPALYFGGTQWMLASSAGGLLGDLSGDIFCVSRPTDVSGASFDYSMITLDREADSASFQYQFPMFFDSGGGSKFTGRYRDNTTTVNGTMAGNTTITPNTNYALWWRCISGTGTGAFAMRVNGTTQTLSYSTTALYDGVANGGKAAWFGTMHSPDSLVLAGLNYNGGSVVESPYPIQDRFKGYITAIAIFGSTAAGGALSANEATAVENWARKLAGT